MNNATVIKRNQLKVLTIQALLNLGNITIQEQLKQIGAELKLWYNVNEDRFYKTK